MDAQQTKGRTWNGYVCPGCRTVFRVAADFIGAEVMCPSCKETLRLPKTPDEVRPHNVILEKPAFSAPPPAVTSAQQPVRAVDHPQAAEPSVLRAMLSTTDGRLKLALALLLPLTLIVCALLFFQPKEFTPEHIILGKAALLDPPAEAPEKPAPPPPPVAVSELPPPPSLPQPEEKTPAPEVAVVQPLPEPATPIVEVIAEEIESPPVISEPSPEPAATLPAPEPALVEVIPATMPEPETPAPPPAPPPAAPPETEPAAAPAERVHNVVRGDTLGKLSRKYQVGITAIKKANGMKGDAVMLGQKLKIPGATPPAAEPPPPVVAETPAPAPQAARTHTVVRGDTLDRIARKHRVTPQQIMQANSMKNDVVRLGRKLVIPAAP